MTGAIRVKTPAGVGIVWGIDRNAVLVEFDYRYLVEFNPDQAERLEIERSELKK